MQYPTKDGCPSHSDVNSLCHKFCRSCYIVIKGNHGNHVEIYTAFEHLKEVNMCKCGKGGILRILVVNENDMICEFQQRKEARSCKGLSNWMSLQTETAVVRWMANGVVR